MYDLLKGEVEMKQQEKLCPLLGSWMEPEWVTDFKEQNQLKQKKEKWSKKK